MSRLVLVGLLPLTKPPAAADLGANPNASTLTLTEEQKWDQAKARSQAKTKKKHELESEGLSSLVTTHVRVRRHIQARHYAGAPSFVTRAANAPVPLGFADSVERQGYSPNCPTATVAAVLAPARGSPSCEFECRVPRAAVALVQLSCRVALHWWQGVIDELRCPSANHEHESRALPFSSPFILL